MKIQKIILRILLTLSVLSVVGTLLSYIAANINSTVGNGIANLFLVVSAYGVVLAILFLFYFALKSFWRGVLVSFLFIFFRFLIVFIFTYFNLPDLNIVATLGNIALIIYIVTILRKI